MKKLLAIATMKCPRCNEASLFSNRGLLPLNQLHKMPEHCPSCGLKFNPEPGFYTGAMYVSYAINIALFITSFFVLYIGLHVNVLSFLLGYGITVLILSPFIFRYSRTLFIHLFYTYEPKAKQEYLQSLRLSSK